MAVNFRRACGRDPVYSNGRRIAMQVAIGRAVVQERQRQGIDCRELARRIGVAGTTLQKIESGDTAPSVWALVQLAHELDVSLDELVPVETNARGAA